MIIATASNAYLLLLRQRPTKAAFVKRARVKRGTYAEELIGDIYDEIFRHCRELKREYQKYYTVEYPRFSAFAENFCWFPPDLLAHANYYYARYTHVIHYVTHQEFLTDDEGIQLLARLLNLKIKS